jgi:hypothetical protein
MTNGFWSLMPYSLYFLRILASSVEGIDHPRVDVDQLAELLGHLVVGGQVVALAADRPAGVHRRQQRLLVDVFQDGRHAGRQIVVEQDGAGIEILQPDAAPVGGAHQRLDHQHVAVGQSQRRRLGDFRGQRTEPHVQAGLAENLHQARDVLQVMRIARVRFGNQQQVAGVRAIFVDRGHGRLHRQRQHLGCKIVKTTRKQVGIDRRQLVAGVAQVDRAVERRGVLLPFHAEPAFDGRRGLEDFLF